MTGVPAQRAARTLLCVGGALSGQEVTTATLVVEGYEPVGAADGPFDLESRRYVYEARHLGMFGKRVEVLVDVSLDESEVDAALVRVLLNRDGAAAYHRGAVIEHDLLSGSRGRR